MSEQDIYKPIEPTSEEVIAKIRRRTALSLPDNPSAAGMSAETIRRRFWEAICGADASVLAEMTRIINEANAAFGEVGNKIEDAKTDIMQETIAERIKAEQASEEAQAHTAEHIGEWLENHPEATTSVKDGSLEESKFSDELKKKAIKDYVTPQMFGAKGDGSHDDTQAFLDAIAYIEDTKRTTAVLPTRSLPLTYLYIPAGTYMIYSTLTIMSHVRIIGAGRENTVLYYVTTDGTPLIYLAGYHEEEEATSNNVIKNLSIVGMGSKCSGIKAYGAHGWKFDNVSVEGCSEGGFLLDECFIGDMYSCYTSNCGNANVPSVYLTSSSSAYDYGCHGVNIYGGEFNTAAGTGLKIRYGSSISIYGTIVEGCRGYGIELDYTQSTLLSGVYTEANSYGDLALRKVFGATVNGCIFMSSAGSILADQVWYTNIFGNTGVDFAWLPDATIKQFNNNFVFGNHGSTYDDEFLEIAKSQGSIVIIAEGSGSISQLCGNLRFGDGVNISSTVGYAQNIASGEVNPDTTVAQSPGSLYLRRHAGTDIPVHASVFYKYNYPKSRSAWKALQIVLSGKTENRPSAELTYMNGLMYFDTTLGKPIWYNEGGGCWVDATGTVV